MRDFQLVRLFLKVVEHKSVSGAARALDIPRSTVSRHLSELETDVGARLVQRSTRSFGLTEAGHTVLQEFRRIVEARDAIDEALHQSDLQGVLRVTAPYSFAVRMLAPVLPGFLLRYPRLSVSMDLSVRKVDLVGEDFDVAIRAGRIDGTALIGRRLGKSPLVLCASPSYLAGQRKIEHADDLVGKAILAFHHTVEMPREWTLVKDDRRVTIAFIPRLAANDHTILFEAALAGAGIACLPERHCKDMLASGALVRCLSDWEHGESEVYALYPSRRALSAKVRAFVDYLAATLTF